MKNSLFIFLLLMICSCKNNSNTNNSSSRLDNPDKFFNINYEDLLNKKQVLGLSQIASNVEYIQLETNKDCLISRGRIQYFFTDSLIFATNHDHILKFSIVGKFLKKIGTPGRGPGEIDLIRTMSIIPERKLIVLQTNANKTLLYFSFEGVLSKTVKIPDIANLKVLNDEKYIAYDDGGNGLTKYTFCLTGKNGDTLSTVKNNNTWVNKSNIGISLGYPSFEPFYFSMNKLFFKAMYNDTIYSVSSNKIEPSYYIDLGKYKLPIELRPERLGFGNLQQFGDKSSNCYFANVFQASDKIFFTSSSYGKAPTKHLLYDTENHTGNLLLDESGASTGFVNDWDGGMIFWPAGRVNDNQLFMPINIISLQKELDRIKTNIKSVKFPEKQKQLVTLISESDASNNPILMIITFKPDKRNCSIK